MSRPRHIDPLVSRIDALRASGVSMEQLADLVGCSRPSLHRWLAARRKAPPTRPPLAERIAAAVASLEQCVRELPNAK